MSARIQRLRVIIVFYRMRKMTLPVLGHGAFTAL